MPETKMCVTCGREIAWRKKWEREWAQVRYCSERCRSHKPGPVDRELEVAIRTLLTPEVDSISPTDAAKVVAPRAWEPLGDQATSAARRLAAAGEVQILQGGQVVDPSTVKGTIRIRRRR